MLSSHGGSKNLTPSNPNPNLNLPYIPKDIQIQILFKLPVKSLLRFKSVSKSWLSLITDPTFIKSHLNQSHKRLFLVRIKSNDKISFTSINYESNESSKMWITGSYSTDVYNPIREEPWLLHYATIMGACNGLLLIKCGFCLYIWNPSTREYKKLSLVGYSDRSLYGFGYDSYVDDYKVVMVVVDSPLFSSTVVYIYSLKTDSFVLIGGFLYDIYSIAKSLLFKGNPHWLVRCDLSKIYGGYHLAEIIVSFDFKENGFKEIPMPSYGFDFNSLKLKLKLGVMGESLCMGCNYIASHFELWVMNDYGVQESWTKLFVISHLLYLQPFTFTNNGDVLMQIGANVLGVYALRRNSFSNFLFPNNDRMFQDSFLYRESLVSPGNRISASSGK